ncbi:NAD(P)H-dependent oxidoreductase [Bacteroidota bacterium]
MIKVFFDIESIGKVEEHKHGAQWGVVFEGEMELSIGGDKDIAGCKECYYCYNHDQCSIKDGMTDIHQSIQKADLLVLASPMYWWGVTGLMKTFIDRLYLYYPKNNGNLIAGKKLLILTPMHVSEEEFGKKIYESEIEPLKMTSKYIFKRLGVEIVDMIFYPGLNAKGDANKNKIQSEETYTLGEKITNYL